MIDKFVFIQELYIPSLHMSVNTCNNKLNVLDLVHDNRYKNASIVKDFELEAKDITMFQKIIDSMRTWKAVQEGSYSVIDSMLR